MKHRKQRRKGISLLRLLSPSLLLLLSTLLLICALWAICFDPPSLAHIEGFYSPARGTQHIPAFQAVTWSPETVSAFVALQQEMNPSVVFDMDTIQRQASQADAEYFLQNRHWNWPKQTIALYNNYVNHQTGTRIDPITSRLQRDQTLYSNEAVLLLMASDSKESRFLIDGVQLPTQPGATPSESIPEDTYGSRERILKCMNPNPQDINGNSEMMIISAGPGTTSSSSSFYSHSTPSTPSTPSLNVQPVDNYKLLPFLVPGFRFADPDTACNPCAALDDPFQSRCAFHIDVGYGDGDKISDIWKVMWGMPMDTSEASEATLVPANTFYHFNDWMVRVYGSVSDFGSSSSDVSGIDQRIHDVSYNVGESLGISVMFEDAVPRLPPSGAQKRRNRRQQQHGKHISGFKWKNFNQAGQHFCLWHQCCVCIV